jgi:hypothetical protein
MPNPDLFDRRKTEDEPRMSGFLLGLASVFLL